jgi:hypothetical protein
VLLHVGRQAGGAQAALGGGADTKLRQRRQLPCLGYCAVAGLCASSEDSRVNIVLRPTTICLAGSSSLQRLCFWKFTLYLIYVATMLHCSMGFDTPYSVTTRHKWTACRSLLIQSRAQP